MPYTVDSENLPKNVKEMPESLREQWVAVFNSAIDDGDDEETAFKKANGAVSSDKGYVDTSYRRLPQTVVNYNPVGGNSEQACANCHWFVSPNSCVIVDGDVSPTGVSDLWRASRVPEQEPIPVTVVEKSLLEKVKEYISTLMPASGTPTWRQDRGPVQSVQPLMFFKTVEGRVRFFTVITNMYKDREDEILSSLAHKEYVAWATENNVYPDLHLWHGGSGSKWGEIDWVDYVDGFVVGGGLVTQGKEYIADNLVGQDLGVSHGFFPLSGHDKVITKYRMFEVSPLPRASAANVWTQFNLSEVNMPFTDTKKQWLKDVAGVSDEVIVEWEQSVDTLSNNLKNMGLEYKEDESTDVVAQQLSALTQAINGVVEKVKSLETEAQKSKDDIVADAFQAQVDTLPQGHQASADNNNVVDQKQSDEALAWFGEAVMKGFK